MKSISWFFLLLIPVFALAGCVPVSATMQPTKRIQLPSLTLPPTTATTIPSLTLTPAITATEFGATLSPTFTPKPVDTLEPEIVRATLEPLLREPLNCAVPCFWGIIPGKTGFDEARTLFSRLGFTPFEGTDLYSGRDFYTINYESNRGRVSSVTLFPSDHRVADIEITPEVAKQKEGGLREWIAYSPETLINKYGKPSRVKFALSWGPNFVITMILYFDNPDLIALYSGYNMIPGRPHSPRVCPLTAPFDDVRLWMGPNPPNPPTMSTIPLEKATSLTIDQFTQLMMGDPQEACFIVNGDVFQ